MEHLDPQVRDIYAQIGLAVSLAQTIERQIAVVLTCASDSLQTAALYDAELEARSKKPLGVLVAELSSEVTLPGRVVQRLKVFVSDRNRVTHRYLRSRGAEFQSVEGQRKMFQELDKLTARFDDLQEDFIQVMARWAQYGALNPETLADCVNRHEA